ncbi:sialin-like [Diachasmimorpha longicaudata]|uniref:sialin-like n=1 Tax=Diachasmimorpha longicaudata TaxID=58733 RepID=UPI0030B869E3
MGKEIFTCRDVLWILVFCGFAINYMLRINLNLAIVAMVVPGSKGPAIAECSLQKITWNIPTNKSLYMLTNPTVAQKPQADSLFHWSEYDQGLALGAYYWFHWLTQLPGGLLARRYGTKMVFGIGNLATAVLGLLIPLATEYHLYGLVTIRVLQGLISGVIWPSMHDMTAKWIPPMERSKFVSAYLGSSVGAAITYPLCAFIIDWMNWRAAFYITSIIGIIWYCFWSFLVYNTPKEHPRISPEECTHIVESLGDTLSSSHTLSKVPWRQLLLSGPVWITIVAHWGGVWGFLTFMTQAPSYFNFVHGWNINATGLLSGLPHVLRMIFSYLYSILSDWLLRTKKMSHQNVRKLANLVTTGGGAIFTLGLSFSGCQPILAIIFMMAGTAINGAVSAGTLAVFVDLSPNFASVLLGFCGLVTTGAGFISPLIVGILTNHRQTIEQWRVVFMIAAANLTISAIAYQFWGTAEVQPWNECNEPAEGISPNELTSLKPKKKNESNETDKEAV